MMKTQVELKIAARMENLDLFLQGRGDTADSLRMEARLNQLQISGWLGTPMTAGRSEQNRAVYVAIGIQMDGCKEALGMWTSANEGAQFSTDDRVQVAGHNG
jgi:Transposase, Mutator family